MVELLQQLDENQTKTLNINRSKVLQTANFETPRQSGRKLYSRTSIIFIAVAITVLPVTSSANSFKLPRYPSYLSAFVPSKHSQNQRKCFQYLDISKRLSSFYVNDSAMQQNEVPTRRSATANDNEVRNMSTRVRRNKVNPKKSTSKKSDKDTNNLKRKADVEINRLSKELNLSIPDLMVQLKKNRPRMSGPRADLVDQLLTYSTAATMDVGGNVESLAPKKLKSEPKQEIKKKAKPTRPKRPTSAKTQEEVAKSQKRAADAIKDSTLLTNDSFAERKDLHPSSKRAVTDVLGLTKMTEIQSKTFAAAASGKDILARARTGTGKTVAFLLPAIEVILQNADSVTGSNIGVLVISPTRELATQIGDQAESLLTFHDNLSVQVVFGGTKIGGDINKMRRQIPTILVATAGRLLDHLENSNISGRKFSDIISNVKVLVLDETDQLLDMGFRREIRKIITYLPRQRQTLLFSATLPAELRNVMAETMRDDSITVDCINDGDGSTHTNTHVNQSHVVLPTAGRFVSSVVETVFQAMKERDEDGDMKIIVFFNTARLVAFFSDLFNKGFDIPVIELHSKKSQSYRNRASNKFRNSNSGILFTSDVSARGVDYPDVTHVIQVRSHITL